jgi:SynChlorMet cassette radical SAM/SPASM protein ScmE
MIAVAPQPRAPVAPVMATPREVSIDVTSRCNLRCRYCSFFGEPGSEGAELSTGEWLRFLEECGRAAVMRVVLSGGEAFIRDDIGAILDGIVHNRMRFAILTNGALVTDAIAGRVAATGRCEYVQVSIDGSRAEVHDTCRGAGAFDGAVRGFRALQRHGVGVVARLTIHRHNVDDIENTVRFILDDLGAPTVGTNSAGEIGCCRANAGDLRLTIEQRQRAMRSLVALAEDYPGRIEAQAGPLAEARMWRSMRDAAAGAGAGPEGGCVLSGCGCVCWRIGVRPDGVYTPCNMLSSMALGRIGVDRLVDVWRDSPQLHLLRERRRTALSSFASCDGCPYISVCTGNCPGMALSMTGSADQPSPDACLRRFEDNGGEVC